MVSWNRSLFFNRNFLLLWQYLCLWMYMLHTRRLCKCRPTINTPIKNARRQVKTRWNPNLSGTGSTRVFWTESWNLKSCWRPPGGPTLHDLWRTCFYWQRTLQPWQLKLQQRIHIFKHCDRLWLIVMSRVELAK